MGLLDLMRVMSIQRQQDQERRRRQAQTQACGKHPPLLISFLAHLPLCMPKPSGSGLSQADLSLIGNKKDLIAAPDVPLSLFSWWLQKAVTPGIEELTLILVPFSAKYNFPCSLLLNGSGDSIRYLHLTRCSFRPTVTLGLRSLMRLHLCLLELRNCDRIVCLKVPRLLQRLNYLEVRGCGKLKVIDNEAPNVSSFTFGGDSTVQISLGETLQKKSLTMDRYGSVFYARAELPSSMPNLEALTIHSKSERAYAPMLCSKFLFLRHLSIALTGAPVYSTYDYLSLASFFYAAPSLETFNLNVWQRYMKNVSIFADPADLRQMQELQHHNLRSVSITGFSSAKSLVELTCHVLKSIISLECLTLEAPQSCVRCSDPANKSGKCSPLALDILMEGHRAVMAIRKYIEPRVPSTVKLHVLEPCSCHDVELQMSCLS
ncbi:putative F-box/FBD/LRR-repeat protein [Panicum miliaceum]|uniref:F-box/FBD/LRR-repeat protein n=1 Tax=Panicum miliaceum TaxID=4540 RepID=A0A3L6RD47_PANMI|nr:putative F-box/FBD/LRR-repeat protein [Panicum miliaceum]